MKRAYATVARRNERGPARRIVGGSTTSAGAWGLSGRPSPWRSIMRRRFLSATVLGLLVGLLASGTVSAHPNNDQTLHFALTCDDGHVWEAAFNGGPSAFHLDGGTLFVWKQISFVTTDNVSGTVGHGIKGFSGAPTVTCTYTGAESGNAYTVVGFYSNSR